MQRTALITGSGRGIGKAIALKLAKEGFNIIVNYVENKAAAIETADSVAKQGVGCIIVKADVSKAEEVRALRREAEKNFGFIDTVINNAGVCGYDFADRVSDIEYNRIIDINMRGVFNVSREFYNSMVSNKFGRMINISSMWGITGASLESVYSASKAAVIGFSKALAKELAPSGITVNVIAPGVIKTDMLNNLSEETIDSLISETPIGRLGSPEDIANAVGFFASENSGFITGAVLNVNGGFII